MSKTKRPPGVCEFEGKVNVAGRSVHLMLFVNVDRLVTRLVKSKGFMTAVAKARTRDTFRGTRLGRGVVFDVVPMDVD